MIKIENLTKTYTLGKENEVHALRGVNVEIPQGKIVAIVGPSGSGKSTMLNILGGLDNDYSGSIKIGDKDLKKFKPTEYRRNFVQTIFQQFYLVPTLNVWENMTLPIKFGKQMSSKKLKERGDYILGKVGLLDRKSHYPNQLSGGQIQRVSIARALITNPKLILADEPTGNLDSKTGNSIMNLLEEINRDEETTVVIITHDLDLIKDVKNKIFLLDGEVDKIEGLKN